MNAIYVCCHVYVAQQGPVTWRAAGRRPRLHPGRCSLACVVVWLVVLTELYW